MSTARDAGPFIGVLVHWSGKVTERSEAGDRLMVDCDGRYFAVRMDTPMAEEIKPGASIEVEGVVVERVAEDLQSCSAARCG